MNSKKHKLTKRLLAMLLTICMFITMVPAGAFAVESQETVDETVVIQNDTSEPTTEGEEDVSTSTGDSEIPEGTATDGTETDTPTEQTITPANDETDDVDGAYTITPSMTQAEVDQAVAEATGPITVQAGNYGGENGAQVLITLGEQGQTVVLENAKEGVDYQRLVIVVLTEGNVLEGNGATINGEVTTEDNQSPAIYIPYGSLTLSGELTLDNHDYGVILGRTNGTTDETAELILEAGAENSPGAVLNITNCRALKDRDTEDDSLHEDTNFNNGMICGGTTYFSYLDTQGDGTRGSAIVTKGNGHAKIIVSEYSELNATENKSTVWNEQENKWETAGAGIFAVDVSSLMLDIQPHAKVTFDENGQGICMNTDPYVEKADIRVDNATLNIINNASNGITGQSKPYLLDVKNGSTVNVNDNGAIGINNFYLKVADHSILNVSDNGTHGATNIGLNVTDSTMTCNDNGYYGIYVTKYLEGKNATEISDSIITTNGNGKPSSNNAGFAGEMKVVLENSVLYSDSAGGYNLYNDADAPATLHISGTDVVVLHGDEDGTSAKQQDIYDDWNSYAHTGRTYVTGGSLQAIYDRMTKGANRSLNDLIPEVKRLESAVTGDDATAKKAEVQYAAPINNNNTALTRFDLNKEVDKGTSLTTDLVEEGATQTYSFKVWDPNIDDEMTKNYTYTFRYNAAGEDLDENTSGNAYVWTPVTMIRYDATEGTIDNGGTAQTKTGDKWSLVNNRGDDSTLNYNVEETYIDAVDYTICGNSLALSEGTLPTATRENQTFAGWYYAVGEDIATAAGYAQDGQYTELYDLLLTSGKKFDANTLTSDDGADIDEITLYAVWTDTVTITPADLTIYIAGEEGYEAVVGGEESPVEQTQNALPKPIFKLNADTDNIKDGMVFTSSEGKSWIATHIEKVDGAESDDEYYSLEPVGAGQDEVRVTYTDSEGVSHISSEFDITEVDELYTEYDIQLYTNTVDINDVVARDSDGKLYSVMLGESGTLTIRTVENTESDKTITPVTTQSPDSRMPERTGKIVVDEDTTYTVNDLGIPMPEGQDPSLLFDTIVTSDGIEREAALENKVAEQVNTPNNRTRRYQSQYLDLVDADNGNIWLTASKPVTVYWAYPDGTDASDDFTLWHFEGLHRDNSDGGQSGFEIGDLEQATVENVRIDKGEYGISFTVEPGGFSPFVLTWTEGSGQPIDPGTDPDDPDTPSLNKDDHFLYIEGYPEDYRTGEYSDNEDLWPVKPQGNITRAEVATIFYRLLKDEVREEIETDVNSFPDVNKDDWFNITVSSLANMGAISGYEDGTFRPNEPITRAELAAMAVRFYDTFEAEYEEGTFLDVDGDEWYADAIAAAEELGILGGYPDGTVRPNNNITRAETCAIVNRVLERRPHDEHLGDVEDMRTWPDNLPGAWYYADMQEATNGHYYEWIDIDGIDFEE